MILFLILITVLLFLIFNYYISNRDVVNPGVLFCASHVLGIFACVLWSHDYGVSFHIETWLVVMLGLLAFTAVNIWFLSYKQKRHRFQTPVKMDFKYIKVRKSILLLIILFQIIVLFLSLRYVISVSRAYYGGGRSIFDYIGLYRSFNIYHADKLRSLGITRNIIVRFGKVLTAICCYPLMAIEANNFAVRKKFDALICVSIFIDIIFSMITGTRSEAFRIITAIAYFYIIISKRKAGGPTGINVKAIIRVAIIIAIVGYGFLAVRDLIGRSHGVAAKWYYSIFPYFGGPFVNIDNALQFTLPSSTIWGQYTFKEIINEFFTGILHIQSYDNSAIYTFNQFNGINTGNVYTTYYPFIVDFGYWGVFPLTMGIAFFYCWTYTKDMNLYTTKSPLNARFFFTGYMFNSLVMLIFSNRFYEHIASVYVFVLVVGMYFYWKVLEKRFITYIAVE